MMMTETEAKKRWCPFARVKVSADVSANRSRLDGDPLPSALCIGSNCMAWKQNGNLPRRDTSPTERQGWIHVCADDSDDGTEFWMEPEQDWRAKFWGYCGLTEPRTRTAPE